MTQAELTILLEKARRITMSPGEREAQRRSFAYGNANIENESVTRSIIDEVANRLAVEPSLDNLLPKDDSDAWREGTH